MMTHQIQQHLDKSYENAVSGSSGGVSSSSSQHHYSPPYSTGLSDQWENVVIPENFPEYYPSKSSSFNLNDYRYNNHMMTTHHHMSYLIKNLMPGTNYEARVQARNDHGWNKLSNVFHFSTRTEGELLLNILVIYMFSFLFLFPLAPTHSLSECAYTHTHTSGIDNCNVSCEVPLIP
jgi:Fibronectin type III domain